MKIDSKYTLQIIIAGLFAMTFVFAAIQLGTSGIKESWIIAILLFILSGVLLAENFLIGKGFKFRADKLISLILACLGFMIAFVSVFSMPEISGWLIPASGIVSLLIAADAWVALYT